jgi:ATP-binding cassette, subfamily C (CFTR/MRP), member 1
VYLVLTSCSIDGLNTSNIGLLDLRRRLAIIPQDAALFEGTIRDNLDPRHVHDDTELWSVLGHARLQEHVTGMEGGLDAAVHEGGKLRSEDPALACEAAANCGVSHE